MVNKEYYKLGQKIRNFRIRSGKSQMDLELEIGASAGSLSRIENGEVNPTKETLLKIIEVLNLVTIEAASLMGIDMSPSYSGLLKFSNEVSNIKELNQMVQKAVDSITNELNLLGAFVVLVDGDIVRLETFAQTFYSEMAMKVIGKPMKEIQAPIEANSENLMVRTVLDKKSYLSNSIEAFVVPAVNNTIAKILGKITGFKSAITMPLIANGKVLGAIHFSKSYIDDFKNETPILESFSEYISQIINKIKQQNGK